MKKVLIGVLLLAGCAVPGKYVKVANDSIKKTVDIKVVAREREFDLNITSAGVVITSQTVTVQYEGSGVFISDNNHVLTCNHLFEAESIQAITVCNSDGDCTAGEVLDKSSELDLALVRTNFDTPTPFIEIADPSSLAVGQEVIAIGSALGFPFSVSHGIISALNRTNLDIENALQTDTFINPGNSGGPLINLQGELVGINSRIVPPVNAAIFTGLGFSVPTEQIIQFISHYTNKFEGLPQYGAVGSKRG